MTTTYSPDKSSSTLSPRHLLSLAIILLLSLGTGLFALSSTTASAASQTSKSLSIVLIGDSYTAGNGAGEYTGPEGAYRSSINWGSRYANWLKSNGVKANVTNLAWSGKTTDEIDDTQIKDIPQNTDLVMFTAGGNDAQFTEVVRRCLALGFRSASLCKERIDYAESQFTNIIASTRTILESLEKKLPSDSQVVLVGYPLLSLDVPSYVLRECVERNRFTNECKKWITYDADKTIREAGATLNTKQAELVKAWNTKSALKVTFIDNQPDFSTHEPHPDADQRNQKRWINEFFETRGKANEKGFINSYSSLDQNNWYHPNITGHERIADRIISDIGIPSSAKEITATSSDTDIVFVVDTTGSMERAIDSVKRDVTSIAGKIKDMSRSSRFSLISYQDHPDPLYSPEDYPAKTHLNFTSDIRSFTEAVNGLSLGNGGDIPESIYSGAMAGLDQSWRPGVRKIMLIIGDAPPHDPEPITGYTWRQVAQRAYDIDPVEIYAVDVGNGKLASPEIVQLTDQSGGKVVYPGSVGIPEAIISSVRDSLAKPFAWIQGPYIATIGETLELDGRASYAVNSDIAKIEWDLNGDGIFETTSPGLLYSHTFTQEFGGTIGIRITDTNGNVGIGSTRLDVTDDGDAIPRDVDNCPDVANQNQADYDEDGIGDDCDDDIGWPTEDIEGVYTTNIEEEKHEASTPTKNNESNQPHTISPPRKSPSILTNPMDMAYPLSPSALLKESEPPIIKTSDNQNKPNPQIRPTDGSQLQTRMPILLGSVAAVIALATAVVTYKRYRAK